MLPLGAGRAWEPSDAVLPLIAVAMCITAPVIFLWRNPTGTGREMSRAQRRAEAGRSVKIYGKVAGLTLAVLGFVAATLPGIVSGITSASVLFQMSGGAAEQTSDMLPPTAAMLLGILAFSLLGLAVTFVASLLWSRKRKVPASIGLALGFRAAALPVAALWLLFYAGAVAQTSRLEAEAEQGMEQSRQHEGRYLADLVGEAWPELEVSKEK